MRNPNGYGGITKLSGKRRNPYRVRVTDRWDEIDGKKVQIYKTIGYFHTFKEANSELSKYHESPEVFVNSGITFEQIYDRWSENKYSKISKSSKKAYIGAYNTCDELWPLKMSDIKTAQLEDVIKNSGKNYPTLLKLKLLLHQLFDYAMANDIVTKNYADFIKLENDSEEKIVRIPFSVEEINTLWDNVNRNVWVDTALIMIYTGLRVGEILIIKNEDVFIDKQYMKGGIKTKAGKNRVIPLHNKIIPLIQNRYNADNEFLITFTNNKVPYSTFRDVYWRNLMEQLKMKHYPYDCRHTFASIAHTCKMDELCRKRIIGHKSADITDDVYTHKEIEELIKEVNKITFDFTSHTQDTNG